MHEYSVIGHPREKIIFAIAFIAIIFGPLTISFIENIYNSITGQVLSLTVAVSFIFSILYFIFNKWLWKVAIFSKVFYFPDLSGIWSCAGQTLNEDGSTKYEWTGKVRIEQSWDKILITMITDNSQSSSLSVIGGIKYIPTIGYKLSYSYNNTPSVKDPELKRHEGFCDLTFTENTKSAVGHYFNGPGRFTFGQITLSRN